MASRTWKIGERAHYGIWKVSINKKEVKIFGIDWNTKKAVEERGFNIDSSSSYEINQYLEDNMDYFHAEQIMKWIESNTRMN